MSGILKTIQENPEAAIVGGAIFTTIGLLESSSHPVIQVAKVATLSTGILVGAAGTIAYKKIKLPSSFTRASLKQFSGEVASKAVDALAEQANANQMDKAQIGGVGLVAGGVAITGLTLAGLPIIIGGVVSAVVFGLATLKVMDAAHERDIKSTLAELSPDGFDAAANQVAQVCDYLLKLFRDGKLTVEDVRDICNQFNEFKGNKWETFQNLQRVGAENLKQVKVNGETARPLNESIEIAEQVKTIEHGGEILQNIRTIFPEGVPNSGTLIDKALKIFSGKDFDYDTIQNIFDIVNILINWGDFSPEEKLDLICGVVALTKDQRTQFLNALTPLDPFFRVDDKSQNNVIIMHLLSIKNWGEVVTEANLICNAMTSISQADKLKILHIAIQAEQNEGITPKEGEKGFAGAGAELSSYFMSTEETIELHDALSRVRNHCRPWVQQFVQITDSHDDKIKLIDAIVSFQSYDNFNEATKNRLVRQLGLVESISERIRILRNELLGSNKGSSSITPSYISKALAKKDPFQAFITNYQNFGEEQPPVDGACKQFIKGLARRLGYEELGKLPADDREFIAKFIRGVPSFMNPRNLSANNLIDVYLKAAGKNPIFGMKMAELMRNENLRQERIREEDRSEEVITNGFHATICSIHIEYRKLCDLPSKDLIDLIIGEARYTHLVDTKQTALGQADQTGLTDYLVGEIIPLALSLGLPFPKKSWLPPVNQAQLAAAQTIIDVKEGGNADAKKIYYNNLLTHSERWRVHTRTNLGEELHTRVRDRTKLLRLVADERRKRAVTPEQLILAIHAATIPTIVVDLVKPAGAELTRLGIDLADLGRINHAQHEEYLNRINNSESDRNLELWVADQLKGKTFTPDEFMSLLKEELKKNPAKYHGIEVDPNMLNVDALKQLLRVPDPTNFLLQKLDAHAYATAVSTINESLGKKNVEFWIATKRREMGRNYLFIELLPLFTAQLKANPNLYPGIIDPVKALTDAGFNAVNPIVPLSEVGYKATVTPLMSAEDQVIQELTAREITAHAPASVAAAPVGPSSSKKKLSFWSKLNG